MIVCLGENRVAVGDGYVDDSFIDSEAVDWTLRKRRGAGQ